MWVVVLTSSQPHHVSACWVFGNEPEAQWFARFVSAEIDPAMVVRAGSPVQELLNWRDEIARKDPEE